LTTTVTGLTTGTYIFNIQTTDNNTATISAKDTLVVTTGGSSLRGRQLQQGASVLDAGSGERFVTLYPNPVEGTQQLTVEGQNWKNGTVRLTIYDLSGKVVKQVVLENSSALFRQTISVSGLAKGSYLLSVRLDDGGKPELLKFVVK